MRVGEPFSPLLSTNILTVKVGPYSSFGLRKSSFNREKSSFVPWTKTRNQNSSEQSSGYVGWIYGVYETRGTTDDPVIQFNVSPYIDTRKERDPGRFWPPEYPWIINPTSSFEWTKYTTKVLCVYGWFGLQKREPPFSMFYVIYIVI